MVDLSANAKLVNKARVYVFNEKDKYQGIWGSLNESGKVKFYLKEGAYKYRVDYRGQWFTELSKDTVVKTSLENFGFRDVVVDLSANAKLVNKARVYVFNEKDKYQGVWGALDASGKVKFYLHDDAYKYRVDYRGQWFTDLSKDTVVKTSLEAFGFRDVVVDLSANAKLVNKARVYVFNEKDKYQGVWGALDESGKVKFYLHENAYKYRVDYRGQWFTELSKDTTVKTSLEAFGFRDVVVDLSANAKLVNKARVYVFNEKDKYQGVWGALDASGKVKFYLHDDAYKYRVDYRGQWFTDLSKDAVVKTSLEAFGFRDVVVDLSANAKLVNKARVYVFNEKDKYQGVWGALDASGKVKFYLHDDAYKYRVDYRGQWFTELSKDAVVKTSLENFGFRNVKIDVSANKDLVKKSRVYVFDGNKKYQGVWGTLDENGKTELYLAKKNYSYRLDFRGQWFTKASDDNEIKVNMSQFGFRNIEIDASVDKALLNKVRVYVFDENNKYQGVWGSFDTNGKVNFFLANKSYKYRIDYRGRWFTKASLPSSTGYWVPVKLSDFGFRKVTLNADADKARLNKIRVYAFDETNKKYQGVWTAFDANGKASMLLPVKNYSYRIDYRGRWFTKASEKSSVNVKLSDFGFRDVVISSPLDKTLLKGKRVYTYLANKYQGVWGTFDVNGEVKLFLSTKEYRYRVDYIGKHYTQASDSAEINVALSDFGFHDVKLEASEKPEVLKGKRVYVFKGKSYQGIYKTFVDGKVEFKLPSEAYRYRVDYAGQHYSPETSSSFVLYSPVDHSFIDQKPAIDVEVTVVRGLGETPVANTLVTVIYNNELTGVTGSTDANGVVTLSAYNEPTTIFQVDYLGNLFEANIVDGAAKVVIPESTITLNLRVQDIGLSGVLVTVLNPDGTTTGISFMTNAEGVATISLPPGSDYQLKLTYQGNEYIVNPSDYPDGNIDFEAVAGEDAPDYSGLTTLDKLISGIYKAIDLNADVLNISLGFDSSDEIPALEAALQDARDTGMVIVAAAGNEVDSTPFWPAASPLTIAVGSVDESLSVSHTKQATWVDIFAPGVGIYSTNKDGDYSYFSGTSFAAPFVSALVAQMLAFDPSLTQSEILSKISTTGSDILTSDFNYPTMKMIDFEQALSDYTSETELLIENSLNLSRFSPAKNESIDSLEVDFAWPLIVGAESYNLWIMDTSTGELVEKVENLISTTHKLILPQGTYAWWIRGLVSGVYTAWSDANLFIKNQTSVLDEAEPSFSWASIENAIEYEFVVHKVDSSGNRLITGYDVSAAKYWENGHLGAVALYTNKYKSKHLYHPGFYEGWVRAKFENGSFSGWKLVVGDLEVPDIGQDLKEVGIVWGAISNAIEYEVVVHKIDADGNEVTRGYDIENAKYWENVGNSSLNENRFIPSKNYENGFYNFWMRAKLENDSLSNWILVHEGLEINEVVLANSLNEFSWAMVPNALSYEIVVNKTDGNGNEILLGYDVSASKFWELGPKSGKSVLNNSFTASRIYEKGFYNIWARPVFSNDDLGGWISVAEDFPVTNTLRPDQVGFTWATVNNAISYEVVVHQVDVLGNKLIEGYDIDAAPYWEKGQLKGIDLKENFYKPAREYVPGLYDAWVHAKLENGNFSSWVKLWDKAEVLDEGQTLQDTGFVWKGVQNSARYEIVVHKVDVDGAVLVSGYDIDAAPLWAQSNSGIQAKFIETNWYQPRQYESGLYDVWVRTQLIDGTTTSWTKVYDKLNVDSTSSIEGFQNIEIRMDEIDSAVIYEVVVNKVDDQGNEILRGYDIDAAPFWAGSSNKNIAIQLKTRVYSPQRLYDEGRYQPWYRAKLADGTLSNWRKSREIIVSSGSFNETELGFTWKPVANAKGYEFVANKIVGNKVVISGYDSEHAPRWYVRSGNLLTHNYYVPTRKYESGTYALWARAVLEDDSLGSWINVNPNFIVNTRKFGSDYQTITWGIDKNATSYEVVVNKLDLNKDLIYKGYDIDAAPLWVNGHQRGEGTEFNYYVPKRLYEKGFYRFWIRSIYADNSLGKWVKARDFEEVEVDLNVANFTWKPIKLAEQYEVVVHKVDVSGQELVHGYDIDAAPWWEESGVRTDNLVTLTTNHYSPIKSYEKGFYMVWVRAKVAGNIRGWKKAYDMFEIK